MGLPPLTPKKGDASPRPLNNFGPDTPHQAAHVLGMPPRTGPQNAHKLSHMRSLDLHASQASSPMRRNGNEHANNTFPRQKLKPRGPVDRADDREIRDFLTSRPHDNGTQTLKSRFNWGDESDSDSLEKHSNVTIRAFERAATRTRTTSETLGVPIQFASPVSSFLGAVDEWVQSGKEHASDKFTQTTKTEPTEEDGATVAIKRSSVLKAFDDPVWDNEDDLTQFMQRATGADVPLRFPVLRSPSDQLLTRTTKNEPLSSPKPIFSGKSSRNITPPALRTLDPGRSGNEKEIGNENVVKRSRGESILRSDGPAASSATLPMPESVATKQISHHHGTPSSPTSQEGPPKRLPPLPPVPPVPPPYQAVQVPTSPAQILAARLAESPNLKNAKGYPRSPEDPEWDEAVKRVKKIVRENEKLEAQEARQRKKEVALMESKMKKLAARKRAARRVAGFMANEPLEDITESEIEVAGASATVPGTFIPRSKRSRTIGSMFTRMRGSTSENEGHAAQVRLELDRHRSHQLLASDVANTTKSASHEEEDAMIQETLRALCGLNDDPSPTPQSPSYAADLKDGNNRVQPTISDDSEGQHGNGLGLSISAEDAYPAASSKLHSDINTMLRATHGSSKPSFYASEEQEMRSDPSNLSVPYSMKRVVSDRPSVTRSTSWTTFDHSQRATIVGEDDSASQYSRMSTEDAVPAPLNIPVLRVRTSQKHLQPSDPNSFIPDRQHSFRAKIQAARRRQAASIGSLSHPAFRGINKNATTSPVGIQQAASHSESNRDRESSESTPTSLSGDETICADEQAPPVPERLRGPVLGNPDTPTSFNEHASPVSSEPNSPPARPTGPSVKIDLPTLREKVGLGPLTLASAEDPIKHPHHPFAWDHEKVMCRQVHNPTEQNAQTPRTEGGSLKYSPKKTMMQATKTCVTCGSFCCRYANLMYMSKIKTSGDALEEMVRVKAQQRVDLLRSQHPNGVEDYETFIICHHCEYRICSGCATKCSNTCHAIICNECAEAGGDCPDVHRTG